MMELSEIRRLNIEAAAKAAKKNRLPFVFSDATEVEHLPLPFPFIGDYIPNGWDKLDKRMFCDMTGLDNSGPALSVKALQDRLLRFYEEDPSYGYAITEHGQFQCVVDVFKKVGKRTKRK